MPQAGMDRACGPRQTASGLAELSPANCSIDLRPPALAGAHAPGRGGQGSDQAEDDAGVLRYGLLAVLLQPPDGADSGADAGSDQRTYTAADHGTRRRSAAGGQRHRRQGADGVIAAQDGAL